MQTIIADVELDGVGLAVHVATLRVGLVPLRVAAYRQTDRQRDLWITTPVSVVVDFDGRVAVSGESGAVRVFISAP